MLYSQRKKRTKKKYELLRYELEHEHASPMGVKRSYLIGESKEENTRKTKDTGLPTSVVAPPVAAGWTAAVAAPAPRQRVWGS